MRKLFLFLIISVTSLNTFADANLEASLHENLSKIDEQIEILTEIRNVHDVLYGFNFFMDNIKNDAGLACNGLSNLSHSVRKKELTDVTPSVETAAKICYDFGIKSQTLPPNMEELVSKGIQDLIPVLKSKLDKLESSSLALKKIN